MFEDRVIENFNSESADEATDTEDIMYENTNDSE
jgi:hypothetical protein